MEKFVVAITRSCGSGGSTVGKMLAVHYGVNFYDREVLRFASEASGINETLFVKADEDEKEAKRGLLHRVSRKNYQNETILTEQEGADYFSEQNLFNYQAKVLRELALKEAYVVIGRAADHILRDNPRMISVFLFAAPEKCIQHEMEIFGMSREEAEAHIARMDQRRAAYCLDHSNRKWAESTNYNLCLDTGKIGYDGAAQVIEAYLDARLAWLKGR
jgi:cytidylate kinase